MPKTATLDSLGSLFHHEDAIEFFDSLWANAMAIVMVAMMVVTWVVLPAHHGMGLSNHKHSEAYHAAPLPEATQSPVYIERGAAPVRQSVPDAASSSDDQPRH